jgi:hypothetical protein
VCQWRFGSDDVALQFPSVHGGDATVSDFGEAPHEDRGLAPTTLARIREMFDETANATTAREADK